MADLSNDNSSHVGNPAPTWRLPPRIHWRPLIVSKKGKFLRFPARPLGAPHAGQTTKPDVENGARRRRVCVCKGFCRDRRLISLLQRIRPRRSPPGQDGDTRAPVLKGGPYVFNTILRTAVVHCLADVGSIFV
jgi:hypothetical protein